MKPAILPTINIRLIETYFKPFCDQTNLTIIKILLQQDSLPICEVKDTLLHRYSIDLSQSAVSFRLSKMYTAGIVRRWNDRGFQRYAVVQQDKIVKLLEIAQDIAMVALMDKKDEEEQ